LAEVVIWFVDGDMAVVDRKIIEIRGREKDKYVERTLLIQQVTRIEGFKGQSEAAVECIRSLRNGL
jgi:hypothetical protein